MTGENKIVLRDLELGEKVPHPGALSLPLGLAVALLKDSEGKIDIDLPVRGNVDDPDFRYGGVVLKALGSLIVKIVASPFALLGNLLGVDASELESIAFLFGRADLTPPEIEKAGMLADALAIRPELVLEIRGVIDREADGLALKTARLDEIIEERIATMTSADTDQAMFSQQQKSVLEQLFAESNLAADPAAALNALRIEYSSDAENNNDTPVEQFDELAYTINLRHQLNVAQPLAESELAELANQRASNTRAAILQANAELDERIHVGRPQAAAVDSDDTVRMKVILRSGTDDEIPDDVDDGENPRAL